MNWNWRRNDEKDENFSEEAATQRWIEDFQEADDGQQEEEKEYYTTSTLRRNHLLLVVASYIVPATTSYMKVIICYVGFFLHCVFQNLGNDHPTTGNSSLRLQPPIPVARAPYLNTIAVFCFPMFSVFPF